MVDHLRDSNIACGVGMTALIVAAARAVETDRAGGLVRDPFAEYFVQAADSPVHLPTHLRTMKESTPEFNQWWNSAVAMGARSKFFDEYLSDSWAAGVRQVVLVAVGLDTRAFRLEWPEGCTVFEIDQPGVLGFKNRVLAERQAEARCARHVVATDLRGDWVGSLLKTGFDTSERTAWLTEGLMPYLSTKAQRQLLDTIQRLSTPGSLLAVDHVDISAMFSVRARESAGYLGIDLSSLIMDQEGVDPTDYLLAQGWLVKSHTLSDLIEPNWWRLSSAASTLPIESAYHLHIAHLQRT